MVMDDAFPADPPDPAITPEERTACAHVRVSVRRREESPGYVTAEWWECDSGCGAKFAPMAALAEAERELEDWRDFAYNWVPSAVDDATARVEARVQAAAERARDAIDADYREHTETETPRQRAEQAEVRLREVERSVVEHFQRDHLEGDGPEIDRWKARLRAVVEVLDKVRPSHHVNEEDCWYSCPKSGDCCNDSRAGDPCDCGADETNARIDAALRAARGEPS